MAVKAWRLRPVLSEGFAGALMSARFDQNKDPLSQEKINET